MSTFHQQQTQQQQQWPRPLNTNEITYLRNQGYTTGMISAFPTLAASTPLRLWIIDNGYLQNTRDATRITGTFESLQSIDNQSRWDETMDCVAFHSQMYTLYKLPTKFTLLNPPAQNNNLGNTGAGGLQLQQTCTIGEGINPSQEVQILKQTMTSITPAGPSKLAEFIHHCSTYIQRIAPQLRQHNQRVAVILATQGRPTMDDDPTQPNPQQTTTQNFLRAIQSLANLPVWVVVRLTTNDESTFDFYNDLDKTPGLGFDVLDDYFGEAIEIYLRNPWLCYGLPLHRFRESGFRIDVLDEIDERPLTHLELWSLALLLFGRDVNVPDPRLDWRGFVGAVSKAMERERKMWNPIKRCQTPWIDLGLLDRMYGQGSVPLQTRPATFSPVQTTPVVGAAYSAQQQSHQPYQQQQQYQQYYQQQPMGNMQQPYYQQRQQTYPTAQAPAPYPQQPTQQQKQQQGYPAQSFPQPVSTPPQQQRQQPPPQQQQQYSPQKPPSTSSAPSPPQPASAPSPSMPAAGQKYAAATPNSSSSTTTHDNTSTLKREILVQWALQPPSYTQIRPIQQLLSSVQNILPPAFGIAQHNYFSKWKPVTLEALSDDGDDAKATSTVLKRAIRKMKFFLHPDKLPKDLDGMQSFLCRMIWDVVADAAEVVNQGKC